MRLLPALLLAGCSQDVQLRPLSDLVSLEVSPADVMVDSTETVLFVATGTFADGRVLDVTPAVAWGVDDAAAGDFVEAGRYATSGMAGGHVTVTAGAGEVTATARVTVVLTAKIIDAAFPPPPGGVELFEQGAPVVGDPTRSPALVYPADGALVPRDLRPVLFQWTAGERNDVSRLAFDSDVLHLRVYTAADRWRPDDGAWRWIVDSTAGASLTLTVTAGAVAEPEVLYGGAPREMAASRHDAGGTIVYWSAARAGLVEGGVAAPAATPFYPVAPDETCVSCHAISRDGTRVALGYGGEILQTIDLPDKDVRIDAADGDAMGWATFSPDGKRLLVADRGALTLYDAETGAPLGPVALGPGTLATHPDWSPRGDAVAVALGSTVTNRDLRGGAIARLTFAADAFSAPEVLVPSTGETDNNFFPRWLPDGEFLIYVHATTSSRNADSAQLRMVRAAAGATPVVLYAANGAPGGGSSLPSAAPFEVDGVTWVAFSSIRPYGLIRPLAGDDQIWITAIDLERAALGVDPSTPALWLPAQDVTQMNHLPVWAVKPLPD